MTSRSISLMPMNGAMRPPSAVDREVARAAARRLPIGPVFHAFERKRDQRRDDQRVEDDRRQDRRLVRAVRGRMTLSTPSSG